MPSGRARTWPPGTRASAACSPSEAPRDVAVRVEIEGRIGKKAAELILGVEWRGEDLRPLYFSAFWEPPELTSLEGCVSGDQEKIGVRIEREDKRDWCVLDVGDRGPDDGFAILLETLERRVRKTRP